MIDWAHEWSAVGLTQADRALFLCLKVCADFCRFKKTILAISKKPRQLQNYDFDKKKCLLNKDGKEIGYYNGSYSEIEVSKHKEWTPDEIKKRGLLMLQFMEERWKFSFDNWNISKEDILFP